MALIDQRLMKHRRFTSRRVLMSITSGVKNIWQLDDQLTVPRSHYAIPLFGCAVHGSLITYTFVLSHKTSSFVTSGTLADHYTYDRCNGDSTVRAKPMYDIAMTAKHKDAVSLNLSPGSEPVGRRSWQL